MIVNICYDTLGTIVLLCKVSCFLVCRHDMIVTICYATLGTIELLCKVSCFLLCLPDMIVNIWARFKWITLANLGSTTMAEAHVLFDCRAHAHMTHPHYAYS